jgi:hypothetical protein
VLIDIFDHEQSMQVHHCYSYLQLFKNGKRSAPMNIKKIKKMPSLQQHEKRPHNHPLHHQQREMNVLI